MFILNFWKPSSGGLKSISSFRTYSSGADRTGVLISCLSFSMFQVRGDFGLLAFLSLVYCLYTDREMLLNAAFRGGGAARSTPSPEIG